MLLCCHNHVAKVLTTTVPPKMASPALTIVPPRVAPPPAGHRAKASPVVVPVTAVKAPPVAPPKSASVVSGSVVPPAVPVPEVAPKAPMAGPARDSAETIVLPPAGSSLPREIPMCAICQDDMLPSQDLLTLWCTHTYHKYCIEEWRHLCNKSEIECPLRCNMQQVNTDGFEIVDPDPEAAGSAGGEAASSAGATEEAQSMDPPAPSENEIGEAAAEVSDSVVWSCEAVRDERDTSLGSAHGQKNIGDTPYTTCTCHLWESQGRISMCWHFAL